jgi:hypothetical protein
MFPLTLVLDSSLNLQLVLWLAGRMTTRRVAQAHPKLDPTAVILQRDASSLVLPAYQNLSPRTVTFKRLDLLLRFLLGDRPISVDGQPLVIVCPAIKSATGRV